MPSTYTFPVLISPLGILFYLHGTTAKQDFLRQYRSSALTSHNLDVLAFDPLTSNLKAGSRKAHAGGWRLLGTETWLENKRGELIYVFGNETNVGSFSAELGKHRADVAFASQEEFASCVRGSQRAGGKKKRVQTATATLDGGSTMLWKKVDAPVNAEELICAGPFIQLPPGDRFAKPEASTAAQPSGAHQPSDAQQPPHPSPQVTSRDIDQHGWAWSAGLVDGPTAGAHAH